MVDDFCTAFRLLKRAQSPNVKIVPFEGGIDKAVKLLQKMNPSYFSNIDEIVVATSPQYGHISSENPRKIFVNWTRVLQEGGGKMTPESIISTALVLAHEKGHADSYDSTNGFKGGEGTAEAEEAKVRNWIESNIQSISDIIKI